jgi:cell division protein ZapA
MEIDRANEIFRININIGGFRLPLNIARKHEEIYRNAGDLLVKHLEDYRKKYPQHSTEEVLTIVAYQFAVMVSKQEFSLDTTPLAEKIQSLHDELEELLNDTVEINL